MKPPFFSLLLILSIGLFPLTLQGQEAAKQDTTKMEKKKDKKGLPLEAARTFRLKTAEGTWTSLDVSPDGKQIAFDLLGDIYLTPIEGGKAERLTKGLAYDTHPKFSPDGKQVAFTSDRNGAENIWTIDLESKEPAQVTKDKDKHYQSAEWTPDGEYLIASKGNRNLKLHMYHKDGGGGVQLIKTPETLKTVEPAFGADERYVWFSRRTGAWNYNAQLPQYQLATYDRETGEVRTRTSRYGSAFSPTLSPDGRWLVYGSRYDEQTGLVKRNLQTGEENWLAYPVQRDEQESIAPLGVYPAMSFTPDSKHLIASYGGKIRKLPIEGGDALEIAFEVDEEIEFGPEVRFEYPISDEETMVATQIRDAVISPDGKQMVFTVLNRLYVMDYPDGKPRQLTTGDHTEAMPIWSPDGKAVAYVSWEGKEGHIYLLNVNGPAQPQRLSKKGALYTEIAWDDKTDRIAFMYGPAQAYRDAYGPQAFGAQQFIGWIPATGGEVTLIEESTGRSNPHFVKDQERIFMHHRQKGLVSMRWDGTDEKEHIKITGITTYPANLDKHCLLTYSEQEPKLKPSSASVITMAPQGNQALAQINNEIYIVMVPKVGGAIPSISVAKPEASQFPSRKLTTIGGQFPQWSTDAKKVYWSIGNAHFSYDLAEAKKVETQLKKEAKEKDKAEEKKEEADKSEEAATDEKKKEDKSYKPGEIRVKVDVKRDIPKGTLLLKGARVITMKGDEVLEKGDILIENNRIKQVGRSGSIKVDKSVKVMDMRGKTIVPGFVDTHAHMWPNWGLHKDQTPAYAANLAYGVTATRDPQTATTDVLTYADRVEAGEIPGPRIYSTGPGVGFWAYNVTDKKHASNILKQYSEYYNTKTIKMYLTGNRQHRQWIIEAAKEQGLMPTTEGGLDFKLNMTQMLDGYPGHEHAFPIYPIYKDVIKMVAKSQMAYTPTMLVAYGGPFAENYFYATEDTQNDEKLKRFTPKAEFDQKTRRRPGWFMKDEHIFSRHAEFVKALVEAGGISGIGSHGQLQGLGYHWELWAVASGGISKHNALKVATILGAKAIGLEKDLGSIETGSWPI